MCQAQHVISHFIFTMNPMEAGILSSPFYRWGNEGPEKLRNLHKVTWLLTRKSEIYPILSNDTLPLNKHPFTPHAKLSAVLRTQQWAKEKLFLTSGNPKISRNLWAFTSNPQLNKKKNQNPEFREGKQFAWGDTDGYRKGTGAQFPGLTSLLCPFCSPTLGAVLLCVSSSKQHY